MITKFRENLKMIDIFGQQITLSFRQQEQYRTSFGGFLSICIIGIIVSFFYSNIIDFFAKNTVTTTTQLEFNENPEQMVFSLKDFMFAVQVEQDYFNTQPFFNITLEQRLYTRDENGTQVRQPTTYIDLVPCTVQHFQPIFDRYNTSIEGMFKQYTLTNFLCPNMSDPLTQNLTIGGGYLSSKYYFLKFVVSACKNTSSTNSYLSWKPVCQSQDAFDKKLASAGSFRFQLYTTNFLINPNDAHNFIKPYIGVDQFYSFVPNAMFVQSDISFRPKTIVTDEGILMYPNKNSEIVANRDYGDYRQQTAITGLTPGYFGAFYFVRSPYSYTIHRNFMRLAELLSYLGGFAQFMIVILGLFIRFYNREHMIIELANDLYQFDLNKKRENTQLHLSKLLSQSQHGRQKLKKSIKDIQLDSAIQVKSFTTFSQKPIMDQHVKPSTINFSNAKLTKQISKKKICDTKLQNSKIFEQFKEFMKPKQYIGISIRLILSQILPFDLLKSDECIVIQRAIDQVNKEFDVQFIMKQLHELIKLKKVLFNDDQIQLFNFSQKPRICLLQDRKRKSGNRQSTIIKSIQDISIQEMALSELFISLVSSYQKIIGLESDEMTQEQRRFNTRLISLLGAKLPTMIEKELDMASEEESFSEPKPEDLNSP